MVGFSTEWSVLERKGNNILDPFNRNGQGIPREPFANDDLNPADFVSGTPVALPEYFAAERRESKGFKVPVLGKLYEFRTISSQKYPCERGRLTEAVADQLRPWPGTIERGRTRRPLIRFGLTKEPYVEDIRDQTTVDKDPCLELDEFRVLAVVFSELTDVRRFPAMKRDTERGTGGHCRHEASHGRQPKRSVGVREL